MIPLEALQALDAIDRKGSFAAAADELFRVPSAITYTIKKLEEQLNIKLFDRQKQRAVLTPTGKLVLEKGREILTKVRLLEEQAQQAESGWEKQLRIVIDTILPYEPFWPLVQNLQEQHTWLNIQIMNESLSGSWEALIQDRADLIIGVSGDQPVAGNWQKMLLGHLQTRLYCGTQHPAANLPQPIDPEQLKNFTHIMISDSARYLTQRNVGMLGIHRTLTVSYMQQKISAIINNIGISHLPTFLAKPLEKQGLLIELQTGYSAALHPSYMYWRKENTGKANAWFRHNIIEKNILVPYLKTGE